MVEAGFFGFQRGQYLAGAEAVVEGQPLEAVEQGVGHEVALIGLLVGQGPQLGGGLQRIHVAQGSVAQLGFGPAQPLLHKIFVDTRNGRNAAGRVAVHRTVAHAGLRAVGGGDEQAVLHIGQQPDTGSSHPRLNILQGQIVGLPGQAPFQRTLDFAHVTSHFIVDAPVMEPGPDTIGQLLGRIIRVVGRIYRALVGAGEQLANQVLVFAQGRCFGRGGHGRVFYCLQGGPACPGLLHHRCGGHREAATAPLKLVRPQLFYAQAHHFSHAHRAEARVGPTAQAQHEAPAARLPQIIEQRQTHGLVQLLVFVGRRQRHNLIGPQQLDRKIYVHPLQIHFPEAQQLVALQQMSVASHQNFAIVNDAPCLIAQQIGVEVRAVKRARGLHHQLVAHIGFAHREVAGRGVHNQIDLAHEPARGPHVVGPPSILANLEAKAYPLVLKNKVAQRPAFALPTHRSRFARHPGRKKARFVVHPIIGQKLLGCEPQNLPITQHRRRVVGAAMQPHWQAHYHANTLGPGAYLLQMRQRRLRHPLTQKQVFAAVTGQAQLGQAQQLYARHFGLLNSRLNIA